MNLRFRKVSILVSLFFLMFFCGSCGSSEKQEDRKTDQMTEKETVAGGQDENNSDQNQNTDSAEKIQKEVVEKDSGMSEEDLIAMGAEIFKSKGCIACHTIGKGKLVGPDLLGVTEIREVKWLRNWLKNPEKMLQTDPIAKEMLKEHLVPMPNQNLTDEEVEALIVYMRAEDQKSK